MASYWAVLFADSPTVMRSVGSYIEIEKMNQVNSLATFRFHHGAVDYRPQLSDNKRLFVKPFAIENPRFLLPFNPVITDPSKEPKIAFFGYNAYCEDNHFRLAQRERNFAEWCQDRYSTKLRNLVRLWWNAIDPSGRGSVYYSNFVKIVLRQDLFARASAVDATLAAHPECSQFFRELAVQEIQHLKRAGCSLFVCFGWSVYAEMHSAAEVAGVDLIREYHFSRYSRKNTDSLIAQVV